MMPNTETLLVLQSHDTVLAQLHHRRSHLPQHAEAASINEQIAKLQQQIAPTRATHASLSAQMAELERQVHELDVKIEALNKQMFGDSARSPRELQAIEADIDSVRRHRSTLEDSELELIESFEPVDSSLASTDAEIAALRARLVEIDSEIAVAQEQIDVDAAAHLEHRAAVAAMIEPSLIELYESIRKSNRGLGVAKLEHSTCMACKLKIAAVELDRIAHLPADALFRCEECGAILVR